MNSALLLRFCAQAKHPLFKYSVKDFLLLLMPGRPVPIMHSYQQVLALWEIVHKNTSSMSGIWGEQSEPCDLSAISLA